MSPVNLNLLVVVLTIVTGAEFVDPPAIEMETCSVVAHLAFIILV